MGHLDKRQLNKQKFVCIDCESTGLDPNNDRIVEIAIVQFSFEEVFHRSETLIDPECEIPKESQEIHHISSEMVKGKPKIKDFLPDVLKIAEGHIIVGHGIGFDLSIIGAECKRSNISSNLSSFRFIDTLRLARYYGGSPVNSLEALRHHFNITPQGSHRAMGDVLVNIEVFKALSRNFQSVDDIFKTLEKPIKLSLMPLGKYKGRRFEEIPLEYLTWAARKDFDQDLLYSLRSEIKQRKKTGNSFALSNNPFANFFQGKEK